MTDNISKAYKEILLFIKALPESYMKKVPQGILKVFEDNQDRDYHPVWEDIITSDSLAKDLNLLHETITLVAWLNLEYWEESEEKKQELRAIYERNGQMKNIKNIQLEKTKKL